MAYPVREETFLAAPGIATYRGPPLRQESPRLRRLIAGALVAASLPTTAASASTDERPPVLVVAERFRGAGDVSTVSGGATDISSPYGPAVLTAQILSDRSGEFLAVSTMTAAGNTAWIVSPGDGVLEVRYASDGRILGERVHADPHPLDPVEETYNHEAEFVCGVATSLITKNVALGLGATLICALAKGGPVQAHNGAAMNWDGQTRTAIDFQPQNTTPGTPYSALADFWVKPVGCRPAASTQECKLPDGSNFLAEMSLRIVWPDGYLQRILHNCYCNYKYFLLQRDIYADPGFAYLYVRFQQHFEFTGNLYIATTSRVYLYE